MKTANSILTFICLILIGSSCVTKEYYQVYKATPTGSMTTTHNAMVYENEHCIVFYNLWGEGGNIGFRFFNKTDRNIYLDLDKSFFILNGQAFDYYLDRTSTYTQSSDFSVSKQKARAKTVTGINYWELIQTNIIQSSEDVGWQFSRGRAIAYQEKQALCVPPQAYKNITEYRIAQYIYRDCNLFLYPNDKQISTKSFSDIESPIVFSNRIAYRVELDDSTIVVNNEFYISEISNLPKSKVIGLKFEEICGEPSMNRIEYFKDATPDKFYIYYK